MAPFTCLASSVDNVCGYLIGHKIGQGFVVGIVPLTYGGETLCIVPNRSVCEL